jgi:putative SOS response-associated peptidase YedK
MCGRYASARPVEVIAQTFGVPEAGIEGTLEPDFNVAPTKSVYAVVDRRTSPATGRRLLVARWGLVPSWARDPSIGSRLINARAETVGSKPAFRRAFDARRALLPADGFYEWWDPGRPGARKQPFFIHPSDGGLLAMAGLYEFWRAGKDDDWLVSVTVLTTTAPDGLGRIHERAPLTVPAADFSAWLDPDRPGAAVAGLLVPAVPGAFDAYPVDTAVNNVRNNGPELIEPLPEG